MRCSRATTFTLIALSITITAGAIGGCAAPTSSPAMLRLTPANWAPSDTAPVTTSFTPVSLTSMSTLTATPDFRRYETYQAYTPTPTPTIPPFEVGGGGFVTTPNLDVSQLPVLEIRMPDGIVPATCAEHYDGSPMTLVGRGTLCLYEPLGLPSQFTLTLTAPDGRAFSETFAVREAGQQTNPTFEGTRTGSVAETETSSELLAIRLSINFLPDLPSGVWTASVTIEADETAFQDAIVVPESQLIAAFPEGQGSDPFAEPPRNYRARDRIAILGQGYAPSSVHTIALYGWNASNEFAPLPAHYATRLQADSEGRFQTVFEVGPQTPPAVYHLIVDPTTDMTLLVGVEELFCANMEICY